MEGTYFEIIPTEVSWLIVKACHGRAGVNLCKSLGLSVDKLILYKIDKYLGITFGEDVSKFKRFLDSRNLILSGSFVLRCILDEEWDDSDIDLFDETGHHDMWNDYGHPITTTTSIDAYDTDFMKMMADPAGRNITGDPFVYHYLNDHYINYIHTYIYKTGVKVQITHLNTCRIQEDVINKLYEEDIKVKDLEGYDDPSRSLVAKDLEGYDGQTSVADGIGPIELDKSTFIDIVWKYICKNFDFDICKFIYYVLDGKAGVKYLNLEGLLNKLITLDNINTFTIAERVRKYQSRGFVINGVPDLGISKSIFIFKDKLCKGHDSSLDMSLSNDLDSGWYNVLHSSRYTPDQNLITGYERYPGHKSTKYMLTKL